MRTKYTPEFDEARKFYPGVKRGLDTEFANFKKKHKDWKEVVPLLKPAIEKQKSLKSWQGGYVPHFQTWLNQRRWEIEEGESLPRKDASFGKCCYRCGSSERYDGRTGVIWREKLPWCKVDCYDKWVGEDRPKYD